MKDNPLQEPSRADFDAAAELFGVLSTPIRLRIIGALCEGERNVSELRKVVEVSQPNMSQQLMVLYRAGVVNRRREGSQVFYCIADETVVRVCKAVCSKVSPHAQEGGEPQPG